MKQKYCEFKCMLPRGCGIILKKLLNNFPPHSNNEPQVIKERDPRHIKVKYVQKSNNALDEMKNKEKLRTSLLF